METLIEENFGGIAARTASKSFDYYENNEEEEERYDTESREDASEDLVPTEITEETLKRIERELCLIKLCWPEVDSRAFSDSPETYRTTSDKEKLLFWHAENFRKQFHAIYSDRKPLLMVCDNECGVQKFVCTSIRPSILPYPELYTWQGCASFVSDHLEYEPPKRPLVMPVVLRSPTWLLKAQRGNSFEYSTLLVSILLGKGYNAYVVSGYASREQVTCDMSMRTCPYLPKLDEPETLQESTDTPRYKMKSPPDFRSKLLLELEAREAKQIEDELAYLEDERLKMLREQERPPPDKYWGNRVHAWVVILPETGGSREHEIDQPFFIEPTSGIAYSPQDCKTSLLYHGVESVWNDKNYWVNMQICDTGCFGIDWELTNTKKWEHLLPGEPWTMRGVEQDEDLDENLPIQQEKHLDMPFSYVEKIDIDSLDFNRRYPNGTKSKYFKKTKVDFYAQYVQIDGLVRKLTMYEDYEYKTRTQEHETFANRVDRLVQTKKFFDTCVAIDYYDRGRPDACKEHRYSINGADGIDEERALQFYDTVRLDGLSMVETGPHHLTQRYINHKDFLYNRHVEFAMDKEHPNQERTISKIMEKYNRNEKIPASKNIAVREFDFVDNEIRLKYHYEKNRITRATKRFVKPSSNDRSDRPAFDPDLIHEYNPDPTATSEKQLDLYYELEKQLKEETDCLTIVRHAEDEISAFLRTRAAENAMPKLVISVFDKNRNDEAKAGIRAKEEALQAQSKREIEPEVDFLGPYLARLGNPAQLTKSQVFYVRQECMNDLKKSLTDRANHISQQFDACSRELIEAQNWLTQSDGKTREEEEELLNLTNEINFQLHTLDVRLERHCELAPERYRKMLAKLNADARLIPADD